MKNILNTKRGGAIALAILFSSLSALAQVPTYGVSTVTLPATIAPAFTTNLLTPLFIDASKQNVVAFQPNTIWSVAGEATGNTNLLFTLCPTVDGTRYDTNRTVTLASYNRSTTAGWTNTYTTNLTANGIKGWYITAIVNNSTGTATNNANYGLTYSTKISAP